MAYTRIEIDCETGEQRVVELTRYEWLCDRYGLPEGTTEVSAEKIHADAQRRAELEANAEAQADAVLRGAAERLAAYDAEAVDRLLSGIEDNEARLAIQAMNALIADIRSLILLQMGGVG